MSTSITCISPEELATHYSRFTYTALGTTKEV